MSATTVKETTLISSTTTYGVEIVVELPRDKRDDLYAMFGSQIDNGIHPSNAMYGINHRSINRFIFYVVQSTGFCSDMSLIETNEVPYLYTTTLGDVLVIELRTKCKVANSNTITRTKFRLIITNFYC